MAYRKTKIWLCIIAVLSVSAVSFIVLVDQKQRDEGDITNIEKSIRNEFGGRWGVTVKEVEMAHTADGNLVGFVRVHEDALGGFDVTHSCTATRVEGNRFIWRCQ